MADRLSALEAKRVAAGISQAELAVRAGIGESTLRRAMKDGAAFPHVIARLTHALRELAKEKSRAATQFDLVQQ